MTAGLFLLTRAAAEGVRVYAVSIVVSIALGTGEITSIAIITLLTLIYTFEGGLAAVIWTDVVQTFIYVGGTLVGLVTILHLVPGGWASVAHCDALHKFQVKLSVRFDTSRTGLSGFPALHALGRDHRRRIPDHRQPWHRPTDRAATAGGAESTAIRAGPVVQRRRHPSFSSRCFFLSASCCLPTTGFHRRRSDARTESIQRSS